MLDLHVFNRKGELEATCHCSMYHWCPNPAFEENLQFQIIENSYIGSQDFKDFHIFEVIVARSKLKTRVDRVRV